MVLNFIVSLNSWGVEPGLNPPNCWASPPPLLHPLSPPKRRARTRWTPICAWRLEGCFNRPRLSRIQPATAAATMNSAGSWRQPVRDQNPAKLSC